MKVYISSTYQDLVDHRAAVDRTLRRMGHDVIGMETYVAEGNKPLVRCLADVKLSDVYVVIVAWRYGTPIKDQPPPGGKSITELEYDHAVSEGKPVLAFLLAPDTPWPPAQVDAMGTEPQAGLRAAEFRALLGRDYLAGMFRSPDDLASQVAAAVSAQGLNRFMVERALAQTSALAPEMAAFSGGATLFDTTIGSIGQMVTSSGSARALVVDLDVDWWSTRLFLLASLLVALTGVRQLVFRLPGGQFFGMASPRDVIDGMAEFFPLCAKFLAELRSTEPSSDTNREMDRQIDLFKTIHDMPLGPGEDLAKVDVRPNLIERWLGEKLIARCIKVPPEGLTMAQVQQIVESFVPFVPIEQERGAPPSITRELQVIDRDAFAFELAREWVRTGMPRNPVR